MRTYWRVQGTRALCDLSGKETYKGVDRCKLVTDSLCVQQETNNIGKQLHSNKKEKFKV